MLYVRPVFAEIAGAPRADAVTARVEGLVARPGFARLTDPANRSDTEEPN